MPPIHVITHQSVAGAIAVPRWLTSDDPSSFRPWVRGQGPLPESFRVAVAGQPVDSCRPGALAFERSRSASTPEALDAALTSGKIAVLVLHPPDPDAMGLHITVFGVVGRDATTLTAEDGLDSEGFAAMEEAVRQDESELVFPVGTTEEVFTQCAQNLFIKRAPREGEAPRHRPASLDRLNHQDEGSNPNTEMMDPAPAST